LEKSEAPPKPSPPGTWFSGIRRKNERETAAGGADKGRKRCQNFVDPKLTRNLKIETTEEGNGTRERIGDVKKNKKV